MRILAKLYAHQQTVSHVPYKSLCKAPAALMPVALWPVDRCPPQSSYQLLEIGTFNNEVPFRHVFVRFTFVQLPCTHLMAFRATFCLNAQHRDFWPQHLQVVCTHCLYSVCGRPTTIFYIAGNKTVCLISFRDTPNKGKSSISRVSTTRYITTKWSYVLNWR